MAFPAPDCPWPLGEIQLTLVFNLSSSAACGAGAACRPFCLGRDKSGHGEEEVDQSEFAGPIDQSTNRGWIVVDETKFVDTLPSTSIGIFILTRLL